MMLQGINPIVFDLVAFELLREEPFQIPAVGCEHFFHLFAEMFAEIKCSQKGRVRRNFQHFCDRHASHCHLSPW